MFFACNLTYIQIIKWSATRLDTTSTSIDLSSNPTFNMSGLLIRANTLTYGLYEFKFTVNLTITTSGQLLTNSLSTYIKVIPTGIAVFGLKNGVTGMLYGSLQSFSLDPASYSLDLYNFTSPYSLQFRFYCYTINTNMVNSSQVSNPIDLYTYKNNSGLTIYANQTCFSSTSLLII